MSLRQRLLLSVLFALQLLNAVEGGGYQYSRPFVSTGHGNSFATLSTVLPLPPVPALPALPTPRPGGIKVLPSTKSIVASYLPPHSAPPKGYGPISTDALAPPSVQFQLQPQQHYVANPPPSPSAPLFTSDSVSQQHQRPAYGQPIGGFPSTGYSPVFASPTGLYAAPTAPTAPNFDNIYVGPEGRPLKQYAVVEIIDNDIEQATSPFLPTGYFDGARAQIGATGTGASATETSSLPHLQRLLQAQQSQQLQSISSSGDGISLGSGGLGYIRLPNGNVYLGSGSLGYISSHQQQQSLRDVRTRSESALPDALHFGHGALDGNNNNGFRFK